MQHSADPTLSSNITPAVDDFHEAANLLPMMDDAALTELAADIEAHGLRDPIWRHADGRIIDGRNRWLACQQASVECRHRTYGCGDETITPFVVSHNRHRRHVTTAQRAAVAADIANLERGANQHAGKVPSIEGTSQAQAAKLMGVSVASVERAAAIKRADPVLHDRVKAGELTAGAARAAIAKACEPLVGGSETEVEADGDEDPDAGDLPTNRDHAPAAFRAVARLKISGTAAATNYEWTDTELKLAEKAPT